MVNVLFNPNGRIPSGPFWTGILILIAVNAAISAASAYVNPMIGIIGIVLLYPFICVYVKRFHDAGKSGWLVLLVILAYIILGFIGGMVLSFTLGGDLTAQVMEAAQSGDQAQIQALQMQMTQTLLIPSIILNAVIALGVAFVVANLRSDPETNKYGPPTTPAAA